LLLGVSGVRTRGARTRTSFTRITSLRRDVRKPRPPTARDYGALYRSFRWQIPARYNIGVDVCDRWAEIDPARTAIFNLGADGAVEEVSYGALREASNRLRQRARRPRHRAWRSRRRCSCRRGQWSH